MRVVSVTIQLICAITIVAFSSIASANEYFCSMPPSHSALDNAVQHPSFSGEDHCIDNNDITCSMMSSCTPYLSPLPTLVVSVPFFCHQTFSTELPHIWHSLSVIPELRPPKHSLI